MQYPQPKATRLEQPLVPDANGIPELRRKEVDTAPTLQKQRQRQVAKKKATEDGAREKKTKEQVYKSVYNKWWTSFCLWAGWNAQEKLVWLDDKGEPLQALDGIMREVRRRLRRG